MYLQRLILHAFRNIGHADFSPDPGFNILWGENAQGKTSTLEGIYLLGHLKSFRGTRGAEMVREGSRESRVTGELVCRGARRQIELTVGEAGKNARIDGKEARRSAEFLGYLRPILFSPEEIWLVKGQPAGRRGLLDRAVFQADPGYLERAQQYQRCLRQRNRLLREECRQAELVPWSEGLIQAGARVRLDRIRYLHRLLPRFCEVYRQISGGREEPALRYPVETDSEEHLRAALGVELERTLERERRIGQTLAGPHRDDPEFLVDGRPLRLFGSQGQQRTFLLAFKAAQVMDLEEQLGEPPLLLLDDMTSELDRRRQGFFFRFLLERKGQVFLTTTDLATLRGEGIRQGRAFRVENGDIRIKQDA